MLERIAKNLLLSAGFLFWLGLSFALVLSFLK